MSDISKETNQPTAPEKNEASAQINTQEPLSSESKERIMSIPVDVQIVLGTTSMPISTLMSLSQGSIITLDKQISDPVDIVVNGRLVAKGEVIVMEDDTSKFGISLIEVLSH